MVLDHLWHIKILNKKMKILTGIDLPFAPSSGSFTLCDGLYSNLPKNNKVRFLALNSGISKDWSKIENVCILKIKKETDQKKFDNYVDAISKEVMKHMAEFNPDIIHIQHLSFGMAVALSKINLPKIAICHGTGVEFAINSKFHQNNVTKVINSANKVIFSTMSMYKDYEKIFDVSKKKIIIPWGIPDELCNQANSKKNWSSKEYNILYAGRLSENKGVDTIIKSLTLLDRRAKLTIIGSGDQLKKLKQLTKELILINRVKFIPFQKRSRLWEYFKDFDTLVVSTKIIEAFCLTAVEAQSYGLPVIYSDIGGTKDVIGKSGIMFKGGDHEDLANKINSLIFNSNLLNNYSKLAVENVKKYKISKTKKSFWDISDKIIDRHLT